MNVSLSTLVFLLIFFISFQFWKSYIGKFSRLILLLFVLIVYIPFVFTPYLYSSFPALLLLYIYGLCLLFGLPFGFLIAKTYNFNAAIVSHKVLVGKIPLFCIYTGVFCGFYASYEVYYKAQLVPQLSIISTITEIARSNAGARYQGEYEPTITQSILISINYFSCLLCGSFCASLNLHGRFFLRHKLLLILPVFSVLSFGLLQNTKASLFYSILLLVAGYMPIKLFIGQSISRYYFRAKFILACGFILVISITFLSFMQGMRFGTSFLSYDQTITMLIEYSLGHCSGFCYWFDHYYCNGLDNNFLQFGTITFAGFTNLFMESIQGASPEHLPKYISNDFETNLDTIFSDLILDFGIYGSMIFILFFGSLVGFFDYYHRRKHLWVLPFLSFLLIGVLWSFVASIYSYSSVLLAFTLYFIFIFHRSFLFRRLFLQSS